MVVELRDKLAAMETPEYERAAPVGRTQLDADVISALINLGYDRRVAEKAVEDGRGQMAQGVAGPDNIGAGANFESLLRSTLQGLSRPIRHPDGRTRSAAGG